MSFLTTLVNNSTLLGVRDISLSLPALRYFDASAGSVQSSRTNALGIIEKQVCLALARSRTDISLNGTNNIVVEGVSDPSFGQHVLVNNVAIDTPNVAMMTYLTDASFITYKFDSTIGIDASSSRVTAPIYDFSCVVFQKETLVLDFSRNMAPDEAGNWTVEFSESLQPNLSRALNSELTARRNNIPFYPISVVEEDFNKKYAVCNNNLGNFYNDPFSVYFTNTPGSVPTAVKFDYSNNQILNPSFLQTVGEPIYNLYIRDDILDYGRNNSNPLFQNELGTFSFQQLEPSGGIVVTSLSNGNAVSTSSLSFQILDQSTNIVTDLDQTMTTNRYNSIFPLNGSHTTDNFVIDTSSNGGGYQFTDNSLNSSNWVSYFVYNPSPPDISGTSPNQQLNLITSSDIRTTKYAYKEYRIQDLNSFKLSFELSKTLVGFDDFFVSFGSTSSGLNNGIIFKMTSNAIQMYKNGNLLTNNYGFNTAVGNFQKVTISYNRVPSGNNVWSVGYGYEGKEDVLSFLNDDTIISDPNRNYWGFGANVGNTPGTCSIKNVRLDVFKSYDSLFLLDSTNLTNNANYMSSYVNYPHTLKIEDGYLTIDNSTNSYEPTRQFFQTALIPRGEILNVNNYNQNGLITLTVPAIDRRFKNYVVANSSSGFSSGTLEDIIVSYDGSDNEYIETNDLVTSDILSSLNSISAQVKEYDLSEQYHFEALKFYDGYRSYSGTKYNYINATDLTQLSYQYQSNETTIYSSHNFSHDEFTYNVQNPSGQIMFIQLLSSQSLVSDTDVSGLYFLNREQNGNVPTAQFSYTNELHSAQDISGTFYGENIKGDVQISNFTMSDLSYVTYRLLLLPKTLEELKNDLTITDASLVYGTIDTFERFQYDGSATYLTLADKSMKKEIKSPAGDSKYYGINLNDLNYSGNINPVVSLDTSFNYIITFDTIKGLARFSSSQAMNQFPTGFHDFELFAYPVDDDSNKNQFKYVVQLPIGHYTNVYFETGYKTRTQFSDFSCNLTFNAKSILGLKAYLQGSGANEEPVANPFDISFGWTNINTEPILVSSNSVNESDLVTYGSIPYFDPITNEQSSGQLYITLITQNNDENTVFSQSLYQPGYVIPLIDRPDDNITNQIFGHYTNSINTDPALPYNIDFNPAKVFNRDTTLDILPDLQLNVITNIQNNQRNYHITSAIFPNLDISLNFPKNTPANLNFWYCPKDIWIVQTNGDESSRVFTQANSINTQLKVTDGIVLRNISFSKPGDRILFDLKGEYISIQLTTYESFSSYGDNNRYDDSTTLGELVYNINSLGSDSGDQLTQYFNLNNKYRGYHSNNPGNDDLQTYIITRTPAQYSFYLNNNSSAVLPLAPMYKDLSNSNIQFADSTNPSNTFSFGLKSTFLQSSINGTNSTLVYPMAVYGDPVKITVETNNPYQTYYQTYYLSLKTYLLYSPGTYRGFNPNPPLPKTFISARVATNSTQTYQIFKNEQYVQIKNYSDKYYENPLGQPWLSNPDRIELVANSSLINVNGGFVELTPSLRLKTYGNNFYFGTNTPTFLISTPPVLTFTAFGINAAKDKYLVDGSLNRLATFDVSEISTNQWTMPILSNTISGLTFNPYADKTDISINNITFKRKNTYTNNLGYYFKALPYNFVGKTNIPVKGNFVKRGRYDNNNTALNTVSEYDLSPTAIQNLTTPDANAGYTLQYSPPFNGVNGTVNYYIGSAFCDGSFSFVIDPAVASNTAVYGIIPYVDVLRQKKYQLQAYKIIDTRNSNIGTSFQINSTSPNVYIHHGVERYTRFIQIPDVSFGATPFNLSTQRSAIQLTDISGWVLDTSFVEQDLNFNLSAYSTTGNTKITNQFLVYADKNIVNLKYLNMPDIFKVVDGDGSSLFRIAYNGTVASDIVSTTQLILNPINSQFSYYETDTFDIVL